jgi:shikimate kinase
VIPDRIVLIGFMGSGKSTVGRILAARLRRTLVDTDALVEQRAGKAVPAIFREQGEPAFRDLEAAVLADLSQRKGIVVATGGGAPAQARNRAFFEAGALTFHLRVSFARALSRARGKGDRPLLDQPEEKIRALYEERQPVYEMLGRGIDADSRTPAEVAEQIITILEGPTRTPPVDSG